MIFLESEMMQVGSLQGTLRDLPSALSEDTASGVSSSFHQVFG